MKISGEVNEKYLFQDLGILEDGMHANISHEDDYAIASVTLEKLFEIEFWWLI